MRRHLDRYVFTEVLGPLGLGFSVFTFIMLVRFLFRSAEMIIRRGLAASEVLELLLFSLPNIIVLTIPMALLFGILIAIGRLSSDSELVAMRASGVSLFALYRPILVLSLVLAFGNTVLTAYVLPRANHNLQLQMLDIVAKTASRQVEPRVFYEEWPNVVLYVRDVAADGQRWQGVFLAPSTLLSDHTVTTAEEGYLRVDENGEQIILVLKNAASHKMDLRKPGDYQLFRHEELQVVLQESFMSDQRARISPSRSVREETLSGLLRRRDDPDESLEIRRLASVEIHKKFSIPAACLVFGLFAVPLGFNNRRGGRSSGFALSILVILVYYILLSNGEDAARAGRTAPWLAMWMPNIAFTVIGLFLLARKNRDKSLLLSQVDLWMRLVFAGWVSRLKDRRDQKRRARSAARREGAIRRSGTYEAVGNGAEAPPSGLFVLRIPKLSMRFPNLVDRWIMALFFRVFFVVLAAGLTLYVVADISDLASEIMENEPGASVVLKYYLYSSLQIFFEISPIFVLVTTLMTFTLLSRTNEITACKALGISLYRVSIPALSAALLISLFSVVLQMNVLPTSNQEVARLKDVIKGKAGARTYGPARRWVFGEGDYLFHYLHHDTTRGSLNQLQVFEFGDRAEITGRAYANQTVWQGEKWVADHGWIRRFEDSREASFELFDKPVLTQYEESPSYFGTETRRPEQMSFTELRQYIAEVERSGQDVPELRVELHNKLAFPAISFVMCLVGLPFSFRLGRSKGTLYGVGVSIVLGMVFLAIFAFFSTLGEAGALPAAIAVWTPGLLFSALSLYLFLGVRT